MPVLNEERHLEAAVDQILRQDYQGELEIVMAVGPSKDRTQEVADALSGKHPNVFVVANPTGKTPAALNAAIANATGDVVVRVDGHALIPADYVTCGVLTLRETGADNVGGIMAAHGTTPFEEAVARAMTSKFGVGGAAFHLGGQAGPALTVYLGCFRADALARVHGYDESMERAQDWEMNLRIRQTGGTVWFTPTMQVEYRPRSTVGALARQYHDYGRWRREVARRHPDTLSLRYLAAPLAVVLVAVGAIAGGIGLAADIRWLAVLGFAMPVGYLVANLAACLMTFATKPSMAIRAAVRLPLVFVTMHGSWGLGFLRGVKS
jgi:glycosyltransferase involved in cell wall biosynthesis